MKSVMEVEASLYWAASSNLQACRRMPEPTELVNHSEEIEAIATNSEWLLLKTICSTSLTTLLIELPDQVLACALWV